MSLEIPVHEGATARHDLPKQFFKGRSISAKGTTDDHLARGGSFFSVNALQFE